MSPFTSHVLLSIINSWDTKEVLLWIFLYALFYSSECCLLPLPLDISVHFCLSSLSVPHSILISTLCLTCIDCSKECTHTHTHIHTNVCWANATLRDLSGLAVLQCVGSHVVCQLPCHHGDSAFSALSSRDVSLYLSLHFYPSHTYTCNHAFLYDLSLFLCIGYNWRARN